MATHRAPKQWSLTKSETVNSFENWRQNLIYTLTLDWNFAPYLTEGVTWQKYTKDEPLRGFANDGSTVDVAVRRTAQQKVTMLELMLGQIANYCPVIARNTIVKKCTSIEHVWQSIRAHFGFQSTGAHFLDLADLVKEPDERPEDLFQRITSFVEDNLLTASGGITHYGEAVTADEEVTPTVENFIVVMWLRLIQKDLPKLVKQKYGTELRTRTIASIKPEISQALDSLLDEIHTTSDARALRSFTKSNSTFKPFRSQQSRPHGSFKCCPLCKQAGRPRVNHFLSECEFLPENDKRYMSKARLIAEIIDDDYHSSQEHSEVECDEPYPSSVDIAPESSAAYCGSSPVVRKVSVGQSPYLDVFYKHHTPRIVIDSGATANLIRRSTADSLGAKITKSSQSAGQADGLSQLSVTGETRFTVTRNKLSLLFHALVVEDLDVPILAGIPFMEVNDVHTRPSRHEVRIGDSAVLHYGSSSDQNKPPTIRRACVLHAPAQASTIWPGEYLEVEIPTSVMSPDATVALEPRAEAPNSRLVKDSRVWPPPTILSCIDGKLRIPNLTDEPKTLKKHEHFCQIRSVYCPTETMVDDVEPQNSISKSKSSLYSSSVTVDPDNLLSPLSRAEISSILREYDEVFNPNIGCYNGAVGPFESVVNMGPVLPPQRKGRMPLYPQNRLRELQTLQNSLESMGVLVKPEEVGVSVEYLNPTFLVNKSSGGSRLVTAFGEVGQYSKPQPSLMPDVDSTLYKIGQWKYLVASDLTSAFYQIPLARESMKYCGIVTPFKGVRVYARCAMGMPGSETALEELMCRVLGDLLEEGVVAKIADDLYCGGNTEQEFILNWKRVLQAISKCGLRLSASKTIICPKSTTILGWHWHLGTLQASPHRIATLSTCSPPATVKGVRSFLGAYKFLARVVPNTSGSLAQLETAVGGKASHEQVVWSEELHEVFCKAQKALMSHQSITLPHPEDQIWIVTDGAVRDPGIGATLYVARQSATGEKILLGGFFSAKLRGRQVSWLPCEIEALAIAAAVKHFSPYISQSCKRPCVLTDSKPCVQAYDKLCRGQFSASPRLSTFLATVCRFQVSVLHLAGKVNIPSDFASRNALPCDAPQCQICSFICQTEVSPILRVSIDDLMSGKVKLPFTTRSTWLSIQAECHDLRRVRAHLKQGTRPSKKIRNIRDVRRYLNVATLSRDGVMVVCQDKPLTMRQELIVVPREVLHGLLTALHVNLCHPTSCQLKASVQRYFYALDLTQSIELVTSGCHQCSALKKTPHFAVEQSTGDPPEALGAMFAADVLRRENQFVLVLRECVSSYTSACLVDNEQRKTLRDALIRLCLELRPLDGPPAVVRTDCAPGFASLINDDLLDYHHIVIELGRVKNVNKNPVAERAIQELESELRLDNPRGGQITTLSLAIATARLNSRIRSNGFSSREVWLQRDQFTNQQLPFQDVDVIMCQYQRRVNNHSHSEMSKSHGRPRAPACDIQVGDIVYLFSDLSKTRSRERYLVTSIEGRWCNIRKFSGVQLRNTSYRIKRTDCFKVESQVHSKPQDRSDSDGDGTECSEQLPTPSVSPPNRPDHIVVPNRPDPIVIPKVIESPAERPGETPLVSLDNPIEDPSEAPFVSPIHSDNYSEAHESNEIIDACQNSDSHDIPLCEPPHSPNASSKRPVRQRRPPSYLKDYFRD